ncbi:hypothetical protein MSPP1_003549 [Malassezia sp. CBS 17886]|nr:hypothetical protein MSPP1_003549 [Malassezia sp. CBS 17886]
MGKRKSERDAQPAEAELPLAKYLSSTEKRVRDRAIRSLAAFLLQSTHRGGLTIPPLELSRLWKGIFYCYWMSDKPLVQQALAQELAGLVLAVAGAAPAGPEPTLPGKQAAAGAHAREGRATELDAGPHTADEQAADEPRSRERALAALDFYQGFWLTMEAEWLGVDKFRVDKYYALMRRYLYTGFCLLRMHSWDSVVVERFVSIMRGTNGPLSSNNLRVPDSITYHVCDLYLPELERAVEGTISGEDAAARPAPLPVIALLRPFIELAATTQSKKVYTRAMDSVVTVFLDACKSFMRITSALDAPPSRKRPRSCAEDEERVDALASVIACMAGEGDDEGDADDASREHGEEMARVASVFRDALRAVLEIASAPHAYAPRRKRLYALWQGEQTP